MSKQVAHNIEVGAILVNIWGHEQTNAYFYQVVKRSDRFVTVRQLSHSTVEDAPMSMTGYNMPVLGQFDPHNSETSRLIVGTDFEGKPTINFKYGSGKVWDGTPQRTTWYG